MQTIIIWTTRIPIIIISMIWLRVWLTHLPHLSYLHGAMDWDISLVVLNSINNHLSKIIISSKEKDHRIIKIINQKKISVRIPSRFKGLTSQSKFRWKVELNSFLWPRMVSPYIKADGSILNTWRHKHGILKLLVIILLTLWV